MNVLVFEDDLVAQLHPITTGRPAYAVTCGGCRLADWLYTLSNHVLSLVRPHLQTIQALDFGFVANQLQREFDWTLYVNARVVPGVKNEHFMERLMSDSQMMPHGAPPIIVNDQHERLAVALIPTQLVADASYDNLPQKLMSLLAAGNHQLSDTIVETMHYPHELIQYHQRNFTENLNFLIDRNDYRQIADGVFVGHRVTLDAQVATNTISGDIVIQDGSQIGPFSYLEGPLLIGPNCRVKEHSSLKDGVCLTHTVKIGGEVEASIIEPFSNKQHYGFLGHSYLGSWINLGAGTCNSDLKNSYGKIQMQLPDRRLDTQMQFVGCFMGDYTKTAINTSIFTGRTIGVCSVLYGVVAQDVPGFVNYASSLGQISVLPPTVMAVTQKRMFDRRGVIQRPCDIQLLQDMFEITRWQRPENLTNEPLRL